PTVASAPFDKPSADVILRSSNNVDFYVYKAVLVLASPVFEDMFGLPQPSNPSQQDIHPDSGLPLVHVTDNGETLEYLLRICYPIRNPVLCDRGVIAAVLEAAVKYGMDDATEQMTQLLHGFFPRESIHVYVIACRLKLETLARAAAHQSLKQCHHYTPAMGHISAGALHRLLHFRRNHAQLAVDYKFCEPSIESTSIAEPVIGPAEDPITSHPFDDPSADTILKSSDGVVFHVHQFVLAMVSDVLSKDLGFAHPGESSGSRTSPLVLSVPEDSQTLLRLLQLSYPMPDPDLKGFVATYTLLRSAIKYNMARAIKYAQTKVAEHIELHPLRVYFIATKHKLVEEERVRWEQVAREAALRAVYEKSDPYVPEMEDVPAGTYCLFLDTRAKVFAIGDSLSSRWTTQLQFTPSPLHWSHPKYESSNAPRVGLGNIHLWLGLYEPAAPPAGTQLGPCTDNRLLAVTRTRHRARSIWRK
ncbi:hypothetical protein B0H21DRAFT_699738, partial [Amylocystis lapponica]